MRNFLVFLIILHLQCKFVVSKGNISEKFRINFILPINHAKKSEFQISLKLLENFSEKILRNIYLETFTCELKYQWKHWKIFFITRSIIRSWRSKFSFATFKLAVWLFVNLSIFFSFLSETLGFLGIFQSSLKIV